MTRQAFRSAYPDLFFLDLEDRAGLNHYLNAVGLLDMDESVLRMEEAGKGIMNCTLRLSTPVRSLIVKQARPWVEKDPQYAAPWDRALREADFYRLTQKAPSVASFLPRLLHADATARLLVLEDLGSGGDYTGIYRGETLTPETVLRLADFLSALHGAFSQVDGPSPLPNREMRELNHAHVFVTPLEPDNRLDLDAIQPGLQSAANRLKASADFCLEVARLGTEVYLTDGPTLLHGDFYPGSLIRTAGGPRVIDPEFCFFGRPEIDVGVLLAHLFLGAQPVSLWDTFRERYEPPPSFQDGLARQLAGVEIMRRVIGYAQLPLIWGFHSRLALLKLAHDLVLQPERTLTELIPISTSP